MNSVRTRSEAYLYYTVKYRGDYRRIEEACQRDEPWERIHSEFSYVSILDEKYPEELRVLKYPPKILFYLGNYGLLNESKISIVGSRIMSEYGIRMTSEITREAGKKHVIVSGMAKGTDYTAQMHAQKTIGVVANGLDIEYPKMNHDLYQKVKESGLLLSEYPSKVRPSKAAFPFRNRIIAALGEKLIVPSCRIRGGTLTTVREALELGKEIYSVPYSLDDMTGEGCNRLLADGAEPILSIEDMKRL